MTPLRSLAQLEAVPAATIGAPEDVEMEVAAWVLAAATAEVARVTDAGAKALRLPVRNFGVYWEHDEEGSGSGTGTGGGGGGGAAAAAAGAESDEEEGAAAPPVARASRGQRRRRLLVNRVELGTAFDFKSVIQILVSEAQACPAKDGYMYVNVVLVVPRASRGGGGGASVAPVLIFPYLYDGGYTNSLCEWELINSKLQSARHHVDSLS